MSGYTPQASHFANAMSRYSASKLLLCIIAISHLAVQAHALPPMLVDSNDLDWVGESAGDPLDPGFVGETMSMPLDPELIQKAKEAGIIKDTESFSNPIIGSASTYLGTPQISQTENSGVTDLSAQSSAQSDQNINITGPWSLDLIALDQMLRHMDLALVQNKDAIMGYGALVSGNNTDTQRAIVSGSKTGNRLSLSVMLIDSLDLYRLDLSLDFHTTGTYIAYSTEGSTWSGDITGTAPLGILMP